jgi:hypothetical protein
MTGGWMAALQHHFVTAIAPMVSASLHLRARGWKYRDGRRPHHSIAPGASDERDGLRRPQLQQLDAIHPGCRARRITEC